MKIETIAIFLVLGSIFGVVIFGTMAFYDGYISDDPLLMCGGLGLMLVFWILFLAIVQGSKNQSLEEEIEELKTDLALLQNRIDWIEDDICKEYKGWDEE